MRKFKQFCTTVVADDYFSAFLDYLHSGSALARWMIPIFEVHTRP